MEDVSTNDIASNNGSDSGGNSMKTLKQCNGVLLKDGTQIQSKSVVITTGTFLRGQINIGCDVRPAGRMGDEPAIGLANSLEALQFRM